MSRTLDLLPHHPHTELRPAPQKQFVIIRTRISSLRNTSKAVQIQLPLEGGEFGLPKVFGHDLGRELFRFADDEGTAVGKPGDDDGGVGGGVGDGFGGEHFVEFFREGFSDAAGFLSDKASGVGDYGIVYVDVGYSFASGTTLRQ